jgi:hypothetical protein
MKSGKLFAVISTMVLLILFTSQQIQAFVSANDIVPVFSDEESDKKQQIEYFVVSGTSLFLQSQSYSNLLLNEYELSGNQSFNCTGALGYAEKAISLLENSLNQYTKAKEAGEIIGYNPQKINLFRFFDYERFITDNSLNAVIAQKVQSYMQTGDILGLYQQNIDNLTGILNTLYTIKDNLKKGLKPDIKVFWNLMQQISESSLFGNYSTVIATAVFNNTGN